jgi:hypothetical protein
LYYRDALERGADFVFRCDDDTYAAPQRLIKFADKGFDCVASARTFKRPWSIIPGGGVWLSRRAVKFLAESTPPRWGCDGAWMHNILDGSGLQILRSGDFSPDTSSWPTPENGVVTSHWCGDDVMRSIHMSLHPETYEPAIATIETQGGSNPGRATLHANGVFLCGGARGNGLWKREGDRIQLEWFFHPAEYVLAPELQEATQRSS